MESSLAKRWPSYAEVEASNPRSLVPIRGFTYSTDLCLGSGSFGKVLLGWTVSGNVPLPPLPLLPLSLSLQDEDKTEVAVKMIEKTFLKKDPKLKENLEREIEILKLMADCEYVVKMLNVQVCVCAYVQCVYVCTRVCMCVCVCVRAHVCACTDKEKTSTSNE